MLVCVLAFLFMAFTGFGTAAFAVDIDFEDHMAADGIIASQVETSPGAVAIEGVIKGASFVYTKDMDSGKMADVKRRLDRDFVLVADDGNVYVIPNIERFVKAEHMNQRVRLIGTVAGDVVQADYLDVKESGRYKKAWIRDYMNLAHR